MWCLAISPSGDHLVTASHDKSLRLWERTREPVILEEEREMVRRAAPAPAQHAGGRLPALTDSSSCLPGAGGRVRGERVQRRRSGGERTDERASAGVRQADSDPAVPVCRFPERLQEKLHQPARRPWRRSKLCVHVRLRLRQRLRCVEVVLRLCVCVQAERIMEALELFQEESRKLEDHKYACQAAGRQVETPPGKPGL